MFAGFYDPDTADSLPNQAEVSNKLRRYFADTVHWVTSLFGGIDADSEALTNAIEKRLLNNTLEISDLARSFYGDAPALQIDAALKDFYINLRDIVSASRRGDMEKANVINQTLYADMGKISALLGSVSGIDRTALQASLYELVYLMLTEAMLIFTHNYDAAIEVYDRMMEMALRTADSLAYGIVQRGQG